MLRIHNFCVCVTNVDSSLVHVAAASLISLDVEVFNYSFEHQCQLFDVYAFLVRTECVYIYSVLQKQC